MYFGRQYNDAGRIYEKNNETMKFHVSDSSGPAIL